MKSIWMSIPRGGQIASKALVMMEVGSWSAKLTNGKQNGVWLGAGIAALQIRSPRKLAPEGCTHWRESGAGPIFMMCLPNQFRRTTLWLKQRAWRQLSPSPDRFGGDIWWMPTSWQGITRTSNNFGLIQLQAAAISNGTKNTSKEGLLKHKSLGVVAQRRSGFSWRKGN